MMGSQLRGLTARVLVAALDRDDFVFRRTKGSHRVYKHPDGRRVVVATHSPDATFPPGTLAATLEAMAWSEEDLQRLGRLR